MRVVIHADSSPEIGTGHVARSLALGAALRDAGASVQLAAGSLVATQRNLAADLGLDVVARDAADRRPDWVVIDAYHLARVDRDRLAHSSVPRALIDDAGRDASDAAIVINANLYALPGRWVKPRNAEALLGPAYALLQREFADIEPERPQPAHADRILITMGGADPEDATGAAIDALAALHASADVRVVIGSSHPQGDDRERQGRDAGFDVVRSPRSLVASLRWCDIVLSACGTTVLEAARLGRPIIGVVIADNQVRVAEALEAEGLGVVAGRHPGLDAARVREIATTLREDVVGRSAMAARGPALVDGHGARRAARSLVTGPMRLRPVSARDSERLFAWRNHPETRRASFETGLVTRSDHERWLRSKLGDAAHRMWIGQIGGREVGVVRFSTERKKATISVTIAPDARAGGLGVRLISAAVETLAEEGFHGDVLAWIRPENAPSLAAFRMSGFRQSASPHADRLLYRLSVGPMG